MTRITGRRRFALWAALLAVLLAAAPPLPAQSPEEIAAGLIQEAYPHLRDEALSAVDGGALLRVAVAAVQQVVAASGASDPPVVPGLTGRDGEDLRAVAAYAQAAARATGRADQVIAAALRAMVRTLGDPLGAAFTPGELARYMADLRGEHGAIGIQVDAVDGRIIVSDVTPESPAARADIREGDQLLDVDASSLSGRTPDYVVDLLRGRPGSQVVLTLRKITGQVQRLSLTREQVREAPVRARMLEPRLAYLRLLEFTERASEDVERSLARLNAQGAQALVFDLRENGGGLVDEAVSVASMFLPSGVVAREERRNDAVSLRVRDVRVRFSGAVIVLVNGGTASASEIVAGALQDERVTLVGARTFGKATVQTVYFLQAGWGMRFTTARYRTRAGRSLEGVGLSPDVPVLTPADQVQGPGDSQFELARFLARRRLDSISQPPARP